MLPQLRLCYATCDVCLCRGKVAILRCCVGEVLISLSKVVSPYVEIPLYSVTKGQCE